MTKHSHEEYLNWLDKAAKACYLATDSAIADSMQVYYKANRAVLVRHRENKHGLCLQRDDQLSWENLAYLCPTCTDVTDALDEVMG